MKKLTLTLIAVCLIVAMSFSLVACSLSLDKVKTNLKSHGYAEQPLTSENLEDIGLKDLKDAALYIKATDDFTYVTVLVFEFNSTKSAKEGLEQLEKDLEDDVKYYRSGKILIAANSEEGLNCAKKKK